MCQHTCSKSVDKIAADCYRMFVTDRKVLTEQRVKLCICLLILLNDNNNNNNN